jgi:hypothetical protein
VIACALFRKLQVLSLANTTEVSCKCINRHVKRKGLPQIILKDGVWPQTVTAIQYVMRTLISLLPAGRMLEHFEGREYSEANYHDE